MIALLKLLQIAEANFEGISTQPPGRVLFGAWSDSKQQMRLGTVISEYAADLEQDGGGAEVIQPDGHTVQELEGDQLLCQPPPGDPAWIEGFGGPIYDLNQIKSYEDRVSRVTSSQS
ncbi:hypothetical protein [uncultured Bradyrhizobium sp.]|uniref:hypothetical protein n=1 Tax=uncultured Bradyrhizobium sp. TaxID=199684 RepID=UPI00260D3FE5|nr:hypothetical protein [uncultured Bradyrhizobium sp.]